MRAERSENVNQQHNEVSPWHDARGERRAAEQAERDRVALERNLIGYIRKAYGPDGDIRTDTDGLVIIRRQPAGEVRTYNIPDVVIGSSLEDAAQRAQDPAQARIIRQAML